MTLICVNLDDAALKVWRTLPHQSRSQIVREWLKGMKEKPEGFQEAAESLTRIPAQDALSSGESFSSKSDKPSSGTDHATTAQPRPIYLRKRGGSTRSLFTNL